MYYFKICFAAALLMLTTAAIASGANEVWTNTASGESGDSVNSNPATVPGTADTAIFSTAGAFTPATILTTACVAMMRG
jgi:hypothetical protein